MAETSFICEHSVEFIIVPDLYKIFSNRYKKIIPLYFWKSREGSVVSYQCNKNIPLQVLVVYARRPKVICPNQDVILVRVNESIFEHALYLEENGIPTLIGFPRISTIMDFYIGCPCSYFRIEKKENYVSELDFQIGIESNKCKEKLPSNINGPLSNEELLSVINCCKVYNSWEEVLNVLKCGMNNINTTGNFYYFYREFNNYKPIYFVFQTEP